MYPQKVLLHDVPQAIGQYRKVIAECKRAECNAIREYHTAVKAAAATTAATVGMYFRYMSYALFKCVCVCMYFMYMWYTLIVCVCACVYMYICICICIYIYIYVNVREHTVVRADAVNAATVAGLCMYAWCVSLQQQHMRLHRSVYVRGLCRCGSSI